MGMPDKRVAFPTVAAKPLSMLPATRVLDTSDKLQIALRTLMPIGYFRTAEITSNSSRMLGQQGSSNNLRDFS